MRGIVLAGGAGSRLDPITRVASKQLQPVYDKPMIYYPLATLMEAGITEILLISTPHDLPRFESLLADGSQWGIRIVYAAQEAPRGIAEAFIIGEEFLAGEPSALILGDNIFYGDTGIEGVVADFTDGATVFAYPVTDPERYGVVELAGEGVVSLVEKPSAPRSNLAVPGFYVVDAEAPERSRDLAPSGRGELEITDLLHTYLAEGRLRATRMSRGVAWLDSGTHDSLLDAANYIATIEKRQGTKIACLEEIAYERGLIAVDDVARMLDAMPASAYRDYVKGVTLDRES